MKIGLYFGSFNPIHIGHLIIANHVAENTDVDQVWLVVSPQNPLKNSSTLLNKYHRLYLATIATEDNPLLKTTDIEFKLPSPSYTIDTLTYLMEKYPQHTFAVIMGSDSYLNLPKWKNYPLLINNYSFYIYTRPGFSVNDAPANITVLDAPLLEISATTIRKLLQAGKSIRYLVPEKVQEEIEKNKYYQLNKSS
jgi:nicotinate-nucleotide adenylyltransferase